jgi:hypothetical protein
MSDQFGFLEGAKSFSESVKTGKEAGKTIGASIEDVQKEAASVAQQKALERRRQIREAEVLKEQYFKRAMIQWQKQEEIRLKEEQVKKDFVKNHGQKRWSEVETIKAKIEKQEKEIENEFRKNLAEVRRVMYMCYALAAIVAWYLTWGHKA